MVQSQLETRDSFRWSAAEGRFTNRTKERRHVVRPLGVFFPRERKKAMIWGNSLDSVAESASPKGPSSHEVGCDEGVNALELTGTLGQFIKAKLYL